MKSYLELKNEETDETKVQTETVYNWKEFRRLKVKPEIILIQMNQHKAQDLKLRERLIFSEEQRKSLVMQEIKLCCVI